MGLPVIDARSFQAKELGWRVNPLFWFKVVTHPGMALLIFGIIGLLCLLALLGAYIPIYHDYQSACVHRSSSGTLLTRNAYSFAYNYAASDYNNQVSKSLGQYDRNRTVMCASVGQDRTVQQNKDEKDANTSTSEYDTRAGQLALFEMCINHTKPDFPSAANLSVYANTPYPYSQPEWNERIDCSQAGVYGGPPITNATLDCALLPLCHLPCTGPDKQALTAMTYESGCQSEWMVHAGLFRTVFALLVYVCLNISRILITTAVVRLCWRSLSKEGFDFRGSVDRMGRITKETAESIKVKTDAAIKHFEGVAWAMLAVSVLIHIPYIAVLSSYGASFNSSTTEGHG